MRIRNRAFRMRSINRSARNEPRVERSPLDPCDKADCARKVVQLECEIESVRTELSSSRVHVDELNSTLATRDDELASLRRQFCTTTEQVEQLKRALAEQDAQQKATLANKDAKLAFLQLEFWNYAFPHADVWFQVLDSKIGEYTRFDAHRTVLADRSSVFAEMFDDDCDRWSHLRIEDTTPPVMAAVIHFCYDGEIDFTDDVTAEDVLEVAQKYDIPFLQKLCDQHLCKASDTEYPARLYLSNQIGGEGTYE